MDSLSDVRHEVVGLEGLGLGGKMESDEVDYKSLFERELKGHRFAVSMAVVVSLAIFVIVIAVAISVLRGAANADAAKARLVDICTTRGGSWIVDGDDGECLNFRSP